MIKLKISDKRDYKKIDIFINGVYFCSTTWSATCKQAIESIKNKYPEHAKSKITANFDNK